MLGRVLRENTELMERYDLLSDAAQLWATWYERPIKRTNQLSGDARQNDWSRRQTGQAIPGRDATLEPMKVVEDLRRGYRAPVGRKRKPGSALA